VPIDKRRSTRATIDHDDCWSMQWIFFALDRSARK